jgi:hypothetical protein
VPILSALNADRADRAPQLKAVVICLMAIIMITLDVNKSDDPEFIGIVSNILNTCVNRSCPTQVYVVEIDHCFDWKWQRFSGKILGALGTWNRRLVIPPFDPQRVVSERFYCSDLAQPAVYRLATARPLHIEQAGDSTKRRVAQVTESGVFLWYSGETMKANQASVLVYQIDARGTSDWYASFSRNEQWKLNRVRDISRRLLEEMMKVPTKVGT